MSDLLELDRSTAPSAGHNNPPSTIDVAKTVQTTLADYLARQPVIQNETEAREAKGMIDRGKVALDEMETDRDRQVRPLNDRVRTINNTFKSVREPFERVFDEVKARLATFVRAEEIRLQAEADERRRLADEAEQIAREAEAREAEAKEDAAAGVFTDVGAAVTEADAAFSDFNRATREAARADRDAHVKIGGGFGRSLSLRNKETLTIENAAQCLKAVGLTPKIQEAMLSAARDYRKLKGKLPAGVRSDVERGL